MQAIDDLDLDLGEKEIDQAVFDLNSFGVFRADVSMAKSFREFEGPEAQS